MKELKGVLGFIMRSFILVLSVFSVFSVFGLSMVTAFAADVNVVFVANGRSSLVTVPQGTDATYMGPTDVNIPGYAFCGWDVSLTNVQSDIIARAVYVPSGSEGQSVDVCNTYHTLPSGILSYTHANTDTIPTATAVSKFPATSMAVPCSLTAEESIRLNPVGVPGSTCVVKWYNGSNGQLWKTDVVSYGTSLPQPDNPCINGLEFVGWDGSWTDITEDRDIIACFYREYHVWYYHGPSGDLIADRHVRATDSLLDSVKYISLEGYGHPEEWDIVYKDDGYTVTMTADYHPGRHDYDGDDDEEKKKKK